MLKGMKFHAKHGYFEHERIIGNEFEVDVSVFLNLQKSANSDRLEDTLDYGRVQSVVAEVMQGPPQFLLERLCFLIGEQVANEWPEILKLEVSVRKFNPPMDGETAYSEVTLLWPR